MTGVEWMAQYDAQQDWHRARRAALVQRVVCHFRKCSANLIPFDEVRSRLRLNQKYYRGVQEIELDRIRGSVNRYTDFTSAFLPRAAHLRKRWERVNAAARTHGLPPIEVYQVGDAYFVLDGNHRVSIARQEHWKTIEAHVCEFVTPVGLSADADLDEVLSAAEQADFLRKTKLGTLRPDARIELTCPGSYAQLECLISAFRGTLESLPGGSVAEDEALVRWYDEVYRPCVEEIRASGIVARFPGRTPADLFLWMWKHEDDLAAEYACPKP